MLKFSFRKLPVDADGKAYDSLEAFQASEIQKLFQHSKVAADEKKELNLAYAEAVLELKDAIIEILELTMDARPAARGQKRPRKPKTTPEAPALALT